MRNLITLSVFLFQLSAWANAVPMAIEFYRSEGTRDVSVQSVYDWEHFSLRIHNIPQGARVTLKSRMFGGFGPLGANADFIADSNGVIDTSLQAPVSGSYAEIDPMGLFWSMGTVSEQAPSSNPRMIFVTAEIAGEVLAEAQLERIGTLSGVQRTPVTMKQDGMEGALYTPPGQGPFPAVITFGGSEGGTGGGERYARMLASNGIAALALGYFQNPGASGELPVGLHDIPLEYFERAIFWLKQRSEISGIRIGVMGASRGGELALLLGATFPQLKAVVSIAPSHLMWPGLPSSNKISEQFAPWSYRGKSLPFVPMEAKWIDTATITSGPLAGKTASYLRGAFLKSAFHFSDQYDAAQIPVEKTRGAILLLAGNDDQLWPSCFFAEMAMSRLRSENHPYSDERHCLNGVGHLINFYPSAAAGIDYLPFGPDLILALGGEARQAAHQADQTRKMILEFLRKNL